MIGASKPTVGLEPSGAAGGPVEPAMVLYLPRNGREVEVDDGRVRKPEALSARPVVSAPSDDQVK